MDKEVYLSERKLLIETECDVSSSFDKTLLTLASGALGLSVTFIKQVIPTPHDTGVLFVAWVLLAVSLSCNLVALLISQSALRRQREILDHVYSGDACAASQRNVPGKLTNILNYVQTVSFLLGVFILVWFVWMNLS